MELLIVASVLVIIISLLNPSLRRIIQKSKDLSCTNNLRNIYTSIQAYADDQDHFLPGPVWYGQKANIMTTDISRFNNLSEYLVPYFPEPLISKTGIKYNPVFICDTNSEMDLSSPNYSRVNYRTNYIKNFGIPFGRKANGQLPKKVTDLPQTEGFLLQDADDINYPYYLHEMPDYPIHSNLTRNTLFANGRVEATGEELKVIDP